MLGWIHQPRIRTPTLAVAPDADNQAQIRKGGFQILLGHQSCSADQAVNDRQRPSTTVSEREPVISRDSNATFKATADWSPSSQQKTAHCSLQLNLDTHISVHIRSYIIRRLGMDKPWCQYAFLDSPSPFSKALINQSMPRLGRQTDLTGPPTTYDLTSRSRHTKVQDT